jgi:hypothetical protein
MTFNPKHIWTGRSELGNLLQENNARLFYEFAKKNKGYVYIMYPPNRTDLIKVGLTKKNPFLRVKSLGTAGVLGGFELVWITEFINVHWAESRVHELLTAYHDQKEFFSTTVDHAKKAMATVKREEEGLLYPTNTMQLLAGDFHAWFKGLEIEAFI